MLSFFKIAHENILLIVVFFLMAGIVGDVRAQSGDLDSSSRKREGAESARKYFIANDREPAASKYRGSKNAEMHYLAIQIGHAFSSDAYSWGGKSHVTGLGGLAVGVSYRVGEWVNSMDLIFRCEFTGYQLPKGSPVKMSILPLIVFPEANSRFPLYFGGGVGLGVFIRQMSSESVLSLDYQLLAGIRLFDLFNGGGLAIETGLKNHIHLLSDGQYNGLYISAGGVFTF